MQFMEFNRRLEKCHLDHDTKYLLSFMMETMLEMERQLSMSATLMSEFANTLGQFVALHEATQDKVKLLLRQGRPDGVEVHSVRNEPEE